jgi:hypothetical protein
MNNQLQNASTSVSLVSLPQNTILYRAQFEEPPPKDSFRTILKCDETGKFGVYFSTGRCIPHGMVLEYQKPMYIGRWKLTVETHLYWGKYSFREMEPDRFYENEVAREANNFILDVDPIDSYNHIDDSAFPIDPIFWEWRPPESEVFLNPDSVKKLILLDYEKVSVDTAKERLMGWKENLERKL